MYEKKKIHMLNWIPFLGRNKEFLFLGMVFVICLFPCKNIIQAADEIISRKGNSYIKIKELSNRDRIMYGTFNHPYSFSEKEIVEMLSNIYFQGKGIIGYGKTERVFSDADLAYVLSPLLMEGFTLLGPTQYLLVYNSLTRPYLKSNHNYFCIFVANQNLYIAFGRIHQELSYRYSDEENLIKNGIEFENPMEVKKGPLWRLIPAAGQSMHPNRENVLMIPLIRHDSDSSVREDTGKVVSKKSLPEKRNNKGVYGQTTEDIAPLNTTENSSSKQTGAVQQPLKEQLRFLKSLLEEGLISGENYERKKNELLDKHF